MPLATGRFPVAFLTRGDEYLSRELITIAPVSRRIRRIPAEVALGPEDGMPLVCAVNLDSMITVPRARLRRQIASLSDDKVRAVDAAIHFALGLET